jgi:phosphotriesterase-related protein
MSTSLNRRTALSLMGGAISELAWRRLEAAPAGPKFPKGAIIRTVLKDLHPETLTGPTLFHEHLSIDLPYFGPPRKTAAPPAATDDVDAMIREVTIAGQEGVACIVDGGHPDMKRSLDALKRIATSTNVHIVASGGYYMRRVYPPELAGESEDQIADGLVKEAFANRYGAYGEIGENPDAPMSDEERKVFRAVGKAHLRTNLPIFTHNAYGTGPNVPKDAGLRQLDTFESVGVKPNRVVIGHTCCLDDPEAEVIKAIAKRGAFVGFDRVTAGMVPDDKKIRMLQKFLDAGYQDQLLLASDFTGRRTEARPGAYGRTLTIFVPKMREAGIREDVIHSILVDNSRRYLAFVPKKT